MTWQQHQVSILSTRTPAIWHGNHSFYFSTRTLAVSDMTPITAPVSDMTTTAANSIFPQEHKHFLTWAQQHQHLTDHNIKFLSYIQEHQQFDMDTTASFYFSTRTLAVSDITPSNSTSLWHDHNSSSFYRYHKQYHRPHSKHFLTWAQQHQHLTWPQHQVSILYTRTPAIWHGNHSKFLL